ncbi:hypothetical protein L596_010515 [Steinernema carpocapsae]|uniref:C-type lectin domain-containing protein n=1 Tax=Steinernema carpocapsae TaxID=34508 RepID=A0A4U5PIQ4_STECR|nr:hypothetical protein L596_010515 [Steinernema carpocapsae]
MKTFLVLVELLFFFSSVTSAQPTPESVFNDSQGLAVESCPEPRCISDCKCPTDWILFPGTNLCYRKFHMRNLPSGSGRDEAEKWCQQYGSHMTSIHSPAEQDFIVNMAIRGETGSYVQTWIGLTYNPETRKSTWSDGCSVGYTNWELEQPSSFKDRTCVQVRYTV